MAKNQLIGLFLKVLTWRLKIWPPDQAPVKLLPGKFIFSHEVPLVPEPLVAAYQRVFKEATYWAETWSQEAVQEKLEREVGRKTSFLVTMEGNLEMPIAGFAWGEILHPNQLGYRIGKALQKTPADFDHLANKLIRRGVNRFVYADEFGIISSFRSGIDPVRGLLQPWLEWAWLEKQVFACLFWTTQSSPIYKLGLYMGFEPIFRTQVEGKDIVFIFNKDFRPLLKVCQNLKTRQIVKLLTAAEKILGHRKKRRKK